MRERLTFERYLVGVRRAYLTVALAPPELSSPASDGAIAALEMAVGHALPVGLRKAWLLANGQGITPDAPLFWETEADDDGRLVGYDFMSVAQAGVAHAGYAARAPSFDEGPEPRDEEIAAGSFLPGWLPFADFGSGSMQLMIDFTPSPSGTLGQVIAVTRDPDGVRWVASSFDTFLATSFAALASDPDYVLQEVNQDGSIAGRRERRDDRE